MTRLELLGWIRSHDMVSVEEMTLSHSSHQPPVPAIRYTNGDQRSIVEEVNEHMHHQQDALHSLHDEYVSTTQRSHILVKHPSSSPLGPQCPMI